MRLAHRNRPAICASASGHTVIEHSNPRLWRSDALGDSPVMSNDTGGGTGLPAAAEGVPHGCPHGCSHAGCPPHAANGGGGTPGQPGPVAAGGPWGGQPLCGVLIAVGPVGQAPVGGGRDCERCQPRSAGCKARTVQPPPDWAIRLQAHLAGRSRAEAAVGPSVQQPASQRRPGPAAPVGRPAQSETRPVAASTPRLPLRPPAGRRCSACPLAAASPPRPPHAPCQRWW